MSLLLTVLTPFLGAPLVALAAGAVAPRPPGVPPA